MPGPRIVVMVPSGSGKSLIGGLLAQRLGLGFIDADDLHPATNRAKMLAGVPLDDNDRMPWLDVVAAAMDAQSRGVVVACSALRRSYRDRLRAGAPDAEFVQLDSDEQTLMERMRRREHFMPPALLRSQLAALEPLAPDERGVIVANTRSPEVVVDAVVAALTSR